MDFISERVGYTKTSEDLTVFIKASKKSDIKKINYLKIWIVLWGFTGVLLVSTFFIPHLLGSAFFYMFGLIGFWGYFLYIAIKAYYFRKYGIETIYVNNDKFMIRRDVYSKPGKPKWFKANEKTPFNVVDEKPGGINAFFYNSFWVITGGTISFGEKKSEFRFGLQLEPEESKKVVNMLNKAIHAKSEKK